MLILDEPTNHLDIDSRDALVAALNDYEGAVLVISHDRHLIEATCNSIWIAQRGTISEFDGDLDDYQRMLVSAGNPKAGGAGNGPQSKEDRRRDRQAAAARREELAPLRKSIRDAEDEVEKLRRKRLAVERQLGDPAIYDGEPDRMIALGKDKARLEADIAAAEERWLALSAKLEDAQQALA
jgi:ATP-binding cassette subfamily F protein 3